ncbi:hypothetical protein [Paenibacillus sp. JNUCC31]|uniref:hypothetical protein n=1 Tax=Paenibacillus sp. JNUCC-31 TaxID=2777983 RepID=UPI001E2C1BB0|nr:hypothetical protein [Paenibacillus sp. JNUCC-31]
MKRGDLSMEELSPIPDPEPHQGVDAEESSTALPAFRYILFPRKGGWSAFPYRWSCWIMPSSNCWGRCHDAG